METLPEILSDKICALLERRYLNGRDIFNLWYLQQPVVPAVRRSYHQRRRPGRLDAPDGGIESP